MAPHETDVTPKGIKPSLEDADPEIDCVPEVEGFAKSKVKCICPRCGKMHIIKMRWIGRGIPHKFCQHCRNRETPPDEED